MMKEQGYGAGYAYDHDAEDGFSGQNYFPDTMSRASFYARSNAATSADLKKKRLDWFRRAAAKRKT